MTSRRQHLAALIATLLMSSSALLSQDGGISDLGDIFPKELADTIKRKEGCKRAPQTVFVLVNPQLQKREAALARRVSWAEWKPVVTQTLSFQPVPDSLLAAAAEDRPALAPPR